MVQDHLLKEGYIMVITEGTFHNKTSISKQMKRLCMCGQK